MRTIVQWGCPPYTEKGGNSVELDELWRQYIDTRHSDLRNCLIEQYDFLVEEVVREVADAFPHLEEKTVLMRWGRLGLIEAVMAFVDETEDFSAFCAPYIRRAVLEDRARFGHGRSRRFVRLVGGPTLEEGAQA